MPNKRTPGGCKCCKPACEGCDSTWQQSTYTVNGFTSNCSFTQWWWTYAPFGPPGTRYYFNTFGQESRQFCSEFDLTELNGTYVLEPYTNVGTGTSSSFFNACRGRYRKTIYPSIVEKTCSNRQYYDNNIYFGSTAYSWSAYIQVDRGTASSNSDGITFNLKQSVTLAPGLTFDTWSWEFGFFVTSAAACCPSTSGSYGFGGFFWDEPGDIITMNKGGSGGAKANFTPTVQITRTFRTTPSDCRYARVTESGDDLITETSDYLVLE